MVYFIKQADYVKIGYTNQLSKRLYQLQTSSHVKLEVIALIDGEREEEKIFHSKFKHLNTSGEWFLYNNEIEEFVDSLDKDLMWHHGFFENDKCIIGLIKRTRIENNGFGLGEVAEPDAQ